MLASFNGVDVRYQPSFQLKDVNLTVPNIPGKRFVKIKNDMEVVGQSRAEGRKYNFPAVVNKSWDLLTKYQDAVYDYVEVPDPWAWFFWNMWDWASDYRLPTGKIESFYTSKTNSGTFANTTPGSLMFVYVNMIEKSRSHTDSWAPEVGARDIVTGRNLGTSRRWEWLFRPTTGQMGMVKADWGTYWELEALDILKSPPSIDVIKSSPWLYGWATEVTPNGYVTNYPQIEVAFREHKDLNGIKAGTPIPFLSKGGSVLIKKSSCTELTPGSKWSPYFPGK